jgi:ADP-heptose:LPS heptosyltransferase
MSFSKKFRQKLSRIVYGFFLNPNNIEVAIVCSGGIGDALCFLNYANYFVKWVDCKFKLDFYYKKTTLESLYDKQYGWLRNLYDSKQIHSRLARYDLVIEFHYRFPKIMFCRYKRLKSFSSKLPILVKTYEKFWRENRFLIESSPRTDGLSCDFCLAQSKNRVSQPDVSDLLNIRNLIFVPYTNNENIVLEKFDVEKNNFIVINRSVDSNNKSPESTKLWPSVYYSRLVDLIKKYHPEYKIILLGPSNKSDPYLGDVIDFRGHTTLNELMVLLKYAKLLICSEGGMVHLRHALSRKKSCVLYGPTSLTFYCYTENINLTAPSCPLDHCEWVVDNWQTRCLKADGPCCLKLQSISPDFVYQKISPLL